VGAVAQEDPVHEQLPLDRVNRASNPWVLWWEEPDGGEQQEARVELAGPVRLNEASQLSVEATGADVRVDLLTQRMPAVDGADESPNCSVALIARSNATHAITLECVK
jgi:hypothetical protein